MTVTDISTGRLSSQHIGSDIFRNPVQLVRAMGAMQAQDYSMALWSIGSRTAGSTEAHIRAALAGGELIRTHVLRPTWHIVAAEDARWMLALSAPHIRMAMRSRHRDLGIDEANEHRSREALADAIRAGRNSRAELVQALQSAGLSTADNSAAHYFMLAELDGLICSAAYKGNTPAYALMDERIAPRPALTDAEALATLARRYFRSRGPASVQDFSWWSGLSAARARTALAAVQDEFAEFRRGEQSYYYCPEASARAQATIAVHTLAAFDEYLLAYANREDVLPAAFQRKAVSNNGIFRPIIVIGGKVCGIWKRVKKPGRLEIHADLFRAVNKSETHRIERAASRFADFIGLPANIHITTV